MQLDKSSESETNETSSIEENDSFLEPNQIMNLHVQYNKFENQLDSKDGLVNALRRKCDLLSQQIQSQQAVSTNYKRKYNQVKKYNSGISSNMKDLQTQLQSLQTEMESMKKETQLKTNNHGQAIPNNHQTFESMRNIEKQIEKFKKQNKILQNNSDLLATETSSITNSVDEDIEDINAKLYKSGTEIKLASKLKECRELQRSLETANSNIRMLETMVRKLKQKNEKGKTKYAECLSEQNQIYLECNSLKHINEQLLHEKTELQSKLNNIVKEKAILNSKIESLEEMSHGMQPQSVGDDLKQELNVLIKEKELAQFQVDALTQELIDLREYKTTKETTINDWSEQLECLQKEKAHLSCDLKTQMEKTDLLTEQLNESNDRLNEIEKAKEVHMLQWYKEKKELMQEIKHLTENKDKQAEYLDNVANTMQDQIHSIEKANQHTKQLQEQLKAEKLENQKAIVKIENLTEQIEKSKMIKADFKTLEQEFTIMKQQYADAKIHWNEETKRFSHSNHEAMQLQQELAIMKNLNKTAATKIKALNDRIHSFQSTKQDSEQIVQNLNKELETATQQLTTMNQNCASLKTALKQKENEFSQLLDKYEKIKVVGSQEIDKIKQDCQEFVDFQNNTIRGILQMHTDPEIMEAIKTFSDNLSDLFSDNINKQQLMAAQATIVDACTRIANNAKQNENDRLQQEMEMHGMMQQLHEQTENVKVEMEEMKHSYQKTIDDMRKERQEMDNKMQDIFKISISEDRMKCVNQVYSTEFSIQQDVQQVTCQLEQVTLITSLALHFTTNNGDSQKCQDTATEFRLFHKLQTQTWIAYNDEQNAFKAHIMNNSSFTKQLNPFFADEIKIEIKSPCVITDTNVKVKFLGVNSSTKAMEKIKPAVIVKQEPKKVETPPKQETEEDEKEDDDDENEIDEKLISLPEKFVNKHETSENDEKHQIDEEIHRMQTAFPNSKKAKKNLTKVIKLKKSKKISEVQLLDSKIQISVQCIKYCLAEEMMPKKDKDRIKDSKIHKEIMTIASKFIKETAKTNAKYDDKNVQFYFLTQIWQCIHFAMFHQQIVDGEMFKDLWSLYFFLIHEMQMKYLSFYTHVQHINGQFSKALQNKELQHPEKVIQRIFDLWNFFILEEERPWQIYLTVLETLAGSKKMNHINFQSFMNIIGNIILSPKTNKNDIQIIMDIINNAVNINKSEIYTNQTEHDKCMNLFLVTLVALMKKSQENIANPNIAKQTVNVQMKFLFLFQMIYQAFAADWKDLKTSESLTKKFAVLRQKIGEHLQLLTASVKQNQSNAKKSI